MSVRGIFKGPALRVAVAVAALTLGLGTAQAATYAYVGSWTVDQGAQWDSRSVAYTGQEAAAHLFGGTASDYVISTISALASDIDFQNWVSVWYAGSFGDCTGFPCGRVVAQDFATSTGGMYLNRGDTSAFVHDWAVGEAFRNYAFKIAAVPLPASGVLLLAGLASIGGLGGLGSLGGMAALRRRKAL